MVTLTHSNHLLIGIIAFLFVLGGCSSSSTDSNPNPDPDPDPDPDPSASFSSGDINPDETYSYTFENEEDVDYYCTYHAPDMTGKIIVSSDAEPVERDTVIMGSMSFSPEELTVAPNTEVIWINESDLVHTATSGTPSGGNNGGGDY